MLLGQGRSGSIDPRSKPASDINVLTDPLTNSLYHFLSLECAHSGYGDDFLDCWEHGGSPGEAGVIQYAIAAAASAKGQGWSTVRKNSEDVPICPKCAKAPLGAAS
jgi:hypothetical protein